MKKILFLVVILLLAGCGRYSDKDLVKDLSNKLKNSKAYHMTGTLEIYRNEEKYTYDVDSSYKKGDYFKVNLINKNNNHEQIILKNKEGVYVLTPSLNKSFKFQSDWPYNNSQIYLLQPIIEDLTSDKERAFEKTKDGYIITSKVNYTTEKEFKKQKIYIDKDKNIKKVEVLDDSNNIKMCINILDIDYKANFDKDYFNSEKYIKKEGDNQTNNEKQNDTQNQSNTTTSSKLEEIVYPMYVPVDTYLSGQDIVETSVGERAILTFSGESEFTVVQETLEDVSSTNFIYGDPYLILDTVGAITDYSVSWISNGVEYNVMSDTMSVDELLTVAQSISVSTTAK